MRITYSATMDYRLPTDIILQSFCVNVYSKQIETKPIDMYNVQYEHIRYLYVYTQCNN